MRQRNISNGISVHAISGTHVVTLGLDATGQARDGLLGFGIRRDDHAGGNARWLRGSKVFESVKPDPTPDQSFSTLHHPVQSFLWGDYTAKPGHTYNYLIRPFYGTPQHLEPGPDVSVDITVEHEDDGLHAVYFNRGAITSQAYAERYGNSAPPHPEDPHDPQTAWLSRGLLEAAIEFIDKTAAGEQLRVAAYEFTYEPVIEAFVRAHHRGVDVRIVYEDGNEDGTGEPTSTTAGNRKAIEDFNVPPQILIPRRHRKDIPHNKFMVWVAGGQPREVWTGSTNFTQSGFLGQSNVGHLVRRPDTAAAFLAYWNQLAGDPDWAPLRDWIMQHSPAPAGLIAPDSVVTLFSPRRHSRMLDWYGERIGAAGQSVMFTAAFGVNIKLAERFSTDRDFLRFIMLEKKPSQKVADLLKRDSDILIARGTTLGRDAFQHKLPGWQLDKWFHDEEHFRGTRGHVFYVHTKYLLVDPLSDDPLVFSGSANFSPNSLLRNDENMLLIRGSQRVADIYLGEFDRLFRHFFFRQTANMHYGTPEEQRKAKFLAEDDSWTDPYYEDGNFKERRRKLFR
jgi:phosphatidylserine/phosphatidylglycerophosphate/cardiolipin synthase-like enzyme